MTLHVVALEDERLLVDRRVLVGPAELVQAVLMGLLGAELIEIEDWTCCGASAAETSSKLLSLALPARNLALAQKSQIEADILVPAAPLPQSAQGRRSHKP